MLQLTNGVKNAYAIQAINAFVIGMISIVVPLLMVDRGVSVESIGIIFSVLPLVAQTNRLIFGTISDYVGRKKFYVMNGFMNIIFLGTYYFASTPLWFLFGKIFEGVRNATLWSVNRAYFLDHSKNKEKILIELRGMNSVFESLGTLLAGFLLILLSYDNTILFLMLLSLFLFPNIRMLKDKTRSTLNLKHAFKSLDVRYRNKRFKNFIWIFLLIGLSWGFIAGYILPLFLDGMGVPVGMIGLLLGVRILMNGLSVYVFSSIWSGKTKLLVGGTLFSILLILLPSVEYSVMPIILVMMGTVAGISDAGYETIFTSITDRNSLGKDMGILMIGVQLGMAVTQALSGFVITNLGFSAMFTMSAILYFMFSISSYKNLK